MSGWALGAGAAVAIELSTGAGSVAARFAGRSATRNLASSRAHAADVLPELGAALRELGATPRELSAVIVGLGPGSYTGLRVAAATALGLARASGAALRGVASFEALARGELRPGERGATLLDARGGEAYLAVYERRATELGTLAAPRVLRAADVAAQLAGVDVLLADAAALRATALDVARFARCSGAPPTALEVLELGLEQLALHGPHQTNEIEPLYLRAFAVTQRKT